MISVAQARNQIMAETQPLPAVTVDTESAVAYYLGADVTSPHPLPFFSNSAMDGFALRSSETLSATNEAPVALLLSGVIPAGAAVDEPVQPASAMQILTGAMIPPGADAVVRQEDVVLEGQRVLLRQPIGSGENIRRRGEEVQAGSVLLSAGTRMTPAAIGAVLGAGISEVEVFARPRVAVITTGSELLRAGEPLQPGMIYNSNGATLCAAVQQCGGNVTFQRHSADNEELLERLLAQALDSCDVLLVTGGVSVGRFDYVKEAAAAVGIKPVFWKVKQKPGKPLFFGTGSGRYMFGLPGNPASALVCYYEYVYPCLRKCMGARQPFLRTVTARLDQQFNKKAGLTHFLKGVFAEDGSVSVLDRQGSHMMSTFGISDCLIVIPEDAETLEKGTEVQVHLLPV